MELILKTMKLIQKTMVPILELFRKPWYHPETVYKTMVPTLELLRKP